jgi:hypothetical protein
MNSFDHNLIWFFAMKIRNTRLQFPELKACHLKIVKRTGRWITECESLSFFRSLFAQLACCCPVFDYSPSAPHQIFSSWSSNLLSIMYALIYSSTRSLEVEGWKCGRRTKFVYAPLHCLSNKKSSIIVLCCHILPMFGPEYKSRAMSFIMDVTGFP